MSKIIFRQCGTRVLTNFCDVFTPPEMKFIQAKEHLKAQRRRERELWREECQYERYAEDWGRCDFD